MTSSLLNILDDSGNGASLEELEAGINRYAKLKNTNGTVEGLSSITAYVVTGIIDFIIKIVLNLKNTVTGIFKDIKRSELEVFIDKNRMSMRLLNDAGYSEIYKTVVPFFPFTAKPLAIAEFCENQFKYFDINRRLNSIIELYMRLAVSLKHNDIDKSVACLSEIKVFNDIDAVVKVNSMLETAVIVRIPKRLDMLGTTFSSVSEIVEATEATLRSSNELNTAASVIENRTAQLYRSFDILREALIEADKAGSDIGKLTGIVKSIQDTGELIASYAMLVREYHHLEHWMTACLEAALGQLKK